MVIYYTVPIHFQVNKQCEWSYRDCDTLTAKVGAWYLCLFSQKFVYIVSKPGMGRANQNFSC